MEMQTKEGFKKAMRDAKAAEDAKKDMESITPKKRGRKPKENIIVNDAEGINVMNDSEETLQTAITMFEDKAKSLYDEACEIVDQAHRYEEHAEILLKLMNKMKGEAK